MFQNLACSKSVFRATRLTTRSEYLKIIIHGVIFHAPVNAREQKKNKWKLFQFNFLIFKFSIL